MQTITTSFDIVPALRWRNVTRTFAAGAVLFSALVALSTIMEKAAHTSALKEFATRLPVVATVSFRAEALPWSAMLRSNLIFWGTWALLTPAIIWTARSLRAGNPVFRITTWILAGTGACILHSAVTGFFQTETVIKGAPSRAFLAGLLQRGEGSAQLNVVAFGLIAGVVHALMYYRDAQARRFRQAELETRLARSELDVLRMQLQPHFFFNTLHTVSALMVNDVPAARRVLAALGELLRQSMDQGGRQEISLHDELEFTMRYIDIQRARFGDRIAIEIDVPASLQTALVPNLVLQPLVENAIRHGIEPYAGTGTVAIAAQTDGSELTISVKNRRSSQAHTSTVHARSGGLALANIQARLGQLYPGRHRFAHGVSANGYDVTLTIPLRQ